MSTTAHRLPLAEATTVAHWLMGRWQMRLPDCAILGSIRRQKETVGDLDLMAPLPDPAGPDPLYDRIAATLGRVGASLFAGDDTSTAQADAPRVPAEVIDGFEPHFKRARFMLAGKSGAEIKVEIGRYVPGKQGNRGWIELIRTGSEEFSKAVATEWKRQNNPPEGKKASDEGFLLRWGPPMAAGERQAVRVPTPHEDRVFYELGCLPVPPEKRGDAVCLLNPRWPDGDRIAAAMRGLGLKDPRAMWNAWNDLRGVEELTT